MLRRVAGGCLGFLLSAAPLAAEWHFTPMVGMTFKGDTTLLIDFDSGASRRHNHFGGAVSLLGDGILGLEAIGVWTPGFFQAENPVVVEKSRVTALMANVVVTAPKRWTEYSLRPFVSGGLGAIRVMQTDSSRVQPYDETFKSFNIGGGAVGFFSQRTGVRFDLRYYRTMRGIPDEVFAIGEPSLRYMTASIGVVLRR